jgi:hypothetical protein
MDNLTIYVNGAPRMRAYKARRKEKAPSTTVFVGRPYSTV